LEQQNYPGGRTLIICLKVLDKVAIQRLKTRKNKNNMYQVQCIKAINIIIF